MMHTLRNTARCAAPLAKRFGKRSGHSLLETIIVLTIIGIMLALLLPAVERARESANVTICENNLHQLQSAVYQFQAYKKKLPDPNVPGTVSGWAIDILPYLEERPLAEALSGNPSLKATFTAATIHHRPRIMTCPSAGDSDVGTPPAAISHYTMWTDPTRTTFTLGDAPPNSGVAWAQSLETNLWLAPRDEGPHSGGYNISDYPGWINGK